MQKQDETNKKKSNSNSNSTSTSTKIIIGGVVIGIAGFCAYKYFSSKNKTDSLYNLYQGFELKSSQEKYEILKKMGDILTKENDPKKLQQICESETMNKFYKILIENISSFNISLQEIIIDIFLIISKNAQNLNMFIEKQFVDELVQLISEEKMEETESRITEKTARIFGNIIKTTKEIKFANYIQEKGGEKKLMRAFRNGNLQTKSSCAYCLTWFAELLPDVIQKSATIEFMESLFESLKEKEPENLTYSLSLINDCIKQNNTNTMMIFKNGGIEKLMELLSNENIQVQCNTSMILSSFIENDPSFADIFCQKNRVIKIITENFFKRYNGQENNKR
ncbi:importin subunit alpha-7 [Anaeramoeba ignava]|uniref:Importin subunit alpha-7 n=1 Tax=Anaeramoeba ignava TaxID=1746090 RepID=A0A9Q0LNQ8_ANAIG|nr:importin subunit alpha-7 [Anaeramoeba ignava]